MKTIKTWWKKLSLKVKMGLLFSGVFLFLWIVGFVLIIWGNFSGWLHYLSIMPMIPIFLVQYLLIESFLPCPKFGGSILVCNTGLLLSSLLALGGIFLVGSFVGYLNEKRKNV
mgnify:CR=1 FL=1